MNMCKEKMMNASILRLQTWDEAVFKEKVSLLSVLLFQNLTSVRNGDCEHVASGGRVLP